MADFCKVILFLPKKAQYADYFFVFGQFVEEKNNVDLFYGLDYSLHLDASVVREDVVACGNVDTQNTPKIKSSNFIILERNDEQVFKVTKIIINKKNVIKALKCDVVLFFYDEASFFNQYFENDDSYFTKLQEKLIAKRVVKHEETNSFMMSTIRSPAIIHLYPILQYSSIAKNIKSIMERFEWAINNKNKETVQVKNLISCGILDIALGMIVMHLLLHFITTKTTDDFPSLFLVTAEKFVDALKRSLNWLTESPAGFKLNREFNAILTKFYIFHTEIWWLFLVLISPGLGMAFKVFTLLGQFSITFQAAILSDILGLVSFHAYCIYAYAAKLYYMQQSGLRSLSRLFLGRKWNPLRGKVDSCHYSADQLFVGTLVFTILLFLLPTTLVYYVVFTWIRLFIVAIGGCLARVRLYLHALPLYSLALWIICAPSICTQVYIEKPTLHSSSQPSVAVLNVRKVRGPLISSLRAGIPNCIDQLPSLMPKGLIKTILTGELLYPV